MASSENCGIGGPDRPLRVAIVGAGPSGFYAAESLFRQEGVAVRVDMFDRLPAPFGLVRYGVAPDHQSMKKVTRVYERTAGHPGFRFFGNVQLGKDLRVEDLRACYDRIIYAVGAETDRRLNIPGEDLEGSYAATSFVGWYNGHPDYRDLEFDLGRERAAVVGVGNVAMDIARILTRDPEELAATDITTPALDALRAGRVKEVILLGRRGVAQAAFSPKEIQEIARLDGVDLVVRPEDVELEPEELAALGPGSPARKNVEYLAGLAREGEGRNARKVRLRFLVSPVEILAEEGRVKALRVERNILVPDERGIPRARGTGEHEILPVGLVFRSIGYHGLPIPGVPFDERRGIIANRDGRVMDPETGRVRPGEYVVGWAKRGPTGLIGTNKSCSAATVSALLEDLDKTSDRTDLPDSEADVAALLAGRGVRFLGFDEWKLLDRIERERGKALGKAREKLPDASAMIAAVDAAKRDPDGISRED